MFNEGVNGLACNSNYENMHLSFSTLTDCTIKFQKRGIGDGVMYSTDLGRTWTLLANEEVLNIGKDVTISWKSTLEPKKDGATNPENGIGSFITTGKFNVFGNIMSLLFGDDFVGKTDMTGFEYAFNHLFSDNVTNVGSDIVNSSNLILPAETMSAFCYRCIFRGCASMVRVPEVPAMNLANYCYASMFSGCTSLSYAPKLPATKMAPFCYTYMFFGNEKMKNAPELPALELAESCYTYMFAFNPMTKSPELKAKELAKLCYQGMFRYCNQLSDITMLGTNIPSTLDSSHPLRAWLDPTPSPTGTFKKHKDQGALPVGVSGIPSGWKVLNADDEGNIVE